MTDLRIGVVGCGNISLTYMRNAALFAGVELVACSDLDAELAAVRAREYGLRAMTVEALLASDDVDLVLNLTVPNAHFTVSQAALEAGKHVFTEKPLAATAAEGPQARAGRRASRSGDRFGARHVPGGRRAAARAS